MLRLRGPMRPLLLKNVLLPLLIVGLLSLTACSEAAAPTPTLTPSPVASATPFVRPTRPTPFTATPTSPTTPMPTVPTAVPVDPLLGLEVPPPFDIDLPEGWGFVYDALLSNVVGSYDMVLLALYQGPVTGGTGTIAVLWNFVSVTSMAEGGQPNMWVDGLRLLRQHVVEQACNIGTDVQRDYTIGGRQAVGTQFSAIDCPEDLPDTAGWFAGLQVENTGFIFYAFTEPIEAIDGSARSELQAILDSVAFRPEDIGVSIVTATPEGAAPEDAAPQATDPTPGSE